MVKPVKLAETKFYKKYLTSYTLNALAMYSSSNPNAFNFSLTV